MMDSFYDAPRRPPQPIPRETFSAFPVVPEISVLCPSNTPRHTFTPYNQWKNNNFLTSNKENINGHFLNAQNTSILKKQVRFESPVLQHRLTGANDPFSNNNKQNMIRTHPENDGNEKPREQDKVLPSFEQMYMANIPNRQLDLSVIDLPKRVTQNESKKEVKKEDKQPKTYRDFLETQKIDKVTLNDSITDIYNYKRNTPRKDVGGPRLTHNEHKFPIENHSKHFVSPVSPILLSQSSKQIMNPVINNVMKDQNPGYDQWNHRQTDNCFSGISKAIAQRNQTPNYENTLKLDAENIKSPINYASKDTCIVTQENKNVDSAQNRFFPQNVEDKCRKMESDIGSGDVFRKKVYQENKLATPTKQNNQFDNGPQKDSPLLNPNMITPDKLRTRGKRECYTQTSLDLTSENKALRVRDDDDFSVRDLLKIITQQSQQMTQQNEQILMLQRQVSELIYQQKDMKGPRQKSIQYEPDKNCCDHNRQCCSKQDSSEHQQIFEKILVGQNQRTNQDRCITSTQHENLNDARRKLSDTPKKNKNNMPNFSIGLTTSFEVSFRRPHVNMNQNEFIQKNNYLGGADQCEPLKIQEVTETDSAPSTENYQRHYEHGIQEKNDVDNKETLVDASMVFREPIRVREPCPSPEPSIKIQMNDFEDSESDEEVSTPDIGASFYKNLMFQVNKILKKAQIETTEEVSYNLKGQHLKNETLHKVREATLKHLRRIGVEVQNGDDSSPSSSSSEDIDKNNYNPEDISFAVKQLLMKYLPAEHLAKLTHKQVPTENPIPCTPKDKMGAIKNRPDFSFATLQYMKKYNLIANNQKEFPQPNKRNQTESPNILDISKLKHQPKLL